MIATWTSCSGEDPEPSDWYVLDRIAEHYGARDAAVAACATSKPEEYADLPDTSYTLAASSGSRRWGVGKQADRQPFVA